MTILTAGEVAGYAERNGCARDRLVEWTAIGWTESGWDTTIVSPAGAIGTWQIMPFNAGIGGGSVADLYDPDYNAKVAMIMSGGGQNCAAWDSCYANIYVSGRASYLNWPEDGSAAFEEMGRLGGVVPLGRGPNITPPAFPGVSGTLQADAAVIQAATAAAYPAGLVRIARISQQLAAVGRPGWRP